MLLPDGTLSPGVRAALHAAHEAGIWVVPTTGRPLVVTEDVMGWLGLDDYWIFANGAVTWHLGRQETIRAHWMDPALVAQLVHRIRERLPAVAFAVEFERDVVFESGFVDVVPVPPDIPDVEDVTTAIKAPVQKILVFNRDPVSLRTIDDLYSGVSGAIGSDGVASYSGLPFIEVASELVTKAEAVSDLAAQLGIPRSAVASFGDNHNDVSMLEWAGRGYAMGNATDDAKLAANEVIGTNTEDGLAAKVLELIAERNGLG